MLIIIKVTTGIIIMILAIVAKAQSVGSKESCVISLLGLIDQNIFNGNSTPSQGDSVRVLISYRPSSEKSGG